MSPKYLILFTLSVLGILLWAFRRSPELAPSVKSFPVSHYRQADIQQGITRYPALTPNSKSPLVRGGVVSHHLLAGDFIARYFQNLGLSHYKQVVIIGPNHGELGNNHLVSSNSSWDTPYGTVMAETKRVAELIDSGGVVSDDVVLSSDHAIEVLVPYIRVYLRDAKVIPIMVSSKTTELEIRKLTEVLQTFGVEDTLFLVSSDFSHYLLPSVAKVKDVESLELIKGFEIDRISHLGNDHVDSGVSLAILLQVMQGLKTTDLEVFDHTDASIIAKSPNSPTTTYYFLNYYATGSRK